MFDHALISVDEDYGLLLEKDHLTDTVERTLGVNQKLQLPARPNVYPHNSFLDYRGREIFRG